MTASSSDLASVQTLPQLLAWRSARTPDGEAYRAFDPVGQNWGSLTWAQTRDRVVRWSAALGHLGLPNGARVAILLPNGLDAMCMDQATLALGQVPVPLHAIDNPGSIAYILADAEVSLLMVEGLAQWHSIAAVGTALPHLRMVVVTGTEEPIGADTAATVPVITLADWLGAAPQQPLAHTPPSADDLAGIVYTSGTTGKPKGVMLTHRNVVADVKAVMARIQPTPDDIFLSFLPLSHTFERTGGYYLPMAAGSCVAYARSVALLAQDLQTVRPTVLVSVPRIYERVYAKVQEKLAPSPLRTRLFQAAVAVGWQRFCAAQRLPMAPASASSPDESGGLWRLVPWPLLQAWVAKPLQAQLGGRLRVAVSGGAPLSPAIARCFLGLGVPVLQGYGMTETSPVVSVNTLTDNHPTSVGRALPGVEVRIGENRELQVRGDLVMKGYWNRPQDTASTVAPDGWLSTGDQAEIIDGRIYIRGRIKDILVTSTGEKVPPADLELAITADPLFAQALVLGEARPFIACVVVLEPVVWAHLAQSLGLDPQQPQSLLHASVQKAVLERIGAATASFARYAMPRAVHLTLDPWTVENGLMTPTLKLKRNPLLARFAVQIETMYQPRDKA